MTLRAASMALGLLCAACADMPAQVSLPASRAGVATQAAPAPRDIGLGGGWDRSLLGLRQQDQRVADIGYRLVTANAALCTDLAPQTGILLHSALQYSPRLRPAVEATFHIDDRPAIEAVAAGSPAAAAGLRPDDIVLAVDDQALATSSTPPPSRPDARPATYAPIEQAQAWIAEAVRTGGASITVLRGQEVKRLALTGAPGCGYDAQVLPGPGLTASADGRHVFVSAALVNYAGSDDMLALVLGHEFAHDVLHHHRRLDRAGFERKSLGELGSTPASLRLAEREADYVGLYLTARAGYDIAHAPDFWRRFPAAEGDFGWSHPDAAARAATLAATRDEILEKMKLGEPLIPNAPAQNPH